VVVVVVAVVVVIDGTSSVTVGSSSSDTTTEEIESSSMESEIEKDPGLLSSPFQSKTKPKIIATAISKSALGAAAEFEGPKLSLLTDPLVFI
tara:strand:+ start:187 stop:462 length:276 start_codon:yes stop_codon:yes gene_type:complete